MSGLVERVAVAINNVEGKYMAPTRQHVLYARTAVATVVADDMHLVPVEPTAEMTGAVRHMLMWLSEDRPTEKSLLEMCVRRGVEPPSDCRDVDHVPPKAVQAYWLYHAMIAAAPEVAS